MATWPPELQQIPNQQGFTQVDRDRTIRSAMGFGPAKIRNRTTTKLQDVVATIEILEDDLDVLTQFYDANNALAWDWVDFVTNLPAQYRFKAPPSYRPIGGQWWSATLQLEVIP